MVTSATAPTSKPRRYETPEGVRLNVQAIEQQYGISPPVFYFRQKNGWPSLNGDALMAVKMRFTTERPNGAGAGVENTYLESEVAAAAMPFKFDGMSQTAHGPRMNADRLKRE